MMVRLLKRGVLRVLDNAGYEVIKKSNQLQFVLSEPLVEVQAVAAELKPLTLAENEVLIREKLEIEPDDIALLEQLRNILQLQGKTIPLELEDQLLSHQIDELKIRLERVHFLRRKLTRERTNEIILDDYRKCGFIPGNLYIQIANVCNLQCVMCGHKTATKDNSYMDDLLFRRCLDEAAHFGICHIVFASAYGEALLHPKGIEYLCEAVARRFLVTIATNGNFLKLEQIRNLAKLNLDYIQYSFFGYDKPSYEKTYVGGSFERASENLRLLKTALIEIGSPSKLTVNGVNITNDPERTTKTRDFLRTLGVQDNEMRLQAPCNFGGQINPGTARSSKINGKSFKPVDRLPLYICPQLLSTPGVLADGRFTACGCIDNNGSLAIGDIRTQTIEEMRNGKSFKSLIEAFVKGDLSKFPMCEKCDIPYGNLQGEYNNTEAEECH